MTLGGTRRDVVGAMCRATAHAPVLIAFATIYLVWGSTYLAIAVAVDTMPPFLMVAVRMLVAGGLLYGFARCRGEAAFTTEQWKSAVVTAALLFVGGYGVVAWAEEEVASGVTALLGTTAPLWLVLIQWARGGGAPRARTWAGLLLGTIGVALLLTGTPGLGRSDVGRMLAVLFASLLWAAGSLRAAGRRTGGSAVRMAGAEMLLGGWMLLGVGMALGEWRRVSVEALTVESLLALGYLTLFGSVAAFTAYRWLLDRVQPSLVATHSYVNPFIALVLGWAVLNEPVGAGVVVSAIAIVGAIVLLKHGARPAPQEAAPGSTASRAPRLTGPRGRRVRSSAARDRAAAA